ARERRSALAGSRLYSVAFLPRGGGLGWPGILCRTPYGMTTGNTRDKTGVTKAWLPTRVRGRRGRRGHLVLEPLSRCPLRLRKLDLRLFLLAGTARGVALAGAFCPPAGDGTLPQPC